MVIFSSLQEFWNNKYFIFEDEKLVNEATEKAAKEELKLDLKWIVFIIDAAFTSFSRLLKNLITSQKLYI